MLLPCDSVVDVELLTEAYILADVIVSGRLKNHEVNYFNIEGTQTYRGVQTYGGHQNIQGHSSMPFYPAKWC